MDGIATKQSATLKRVSCLGGKPIKIEHGTDGVAPGGMVEYLFVFVLICPAPVSLQSRLFALLAVTSCSEELSQSGWLAVRVSFVISPLCMRTCVLCALSSFGSHYPLPDSRVAHTLLVRRFLWKRRRASLLRTGDLGPCGADARWRQAAGSCPLFPALQRSTGGEVAPIPTEFRP